MQPEAFFRLSQTLDAIDLRLFHDVYRHQRDDAELQLSSYLSNIGFRKIHILNMVRSELVNNIRRLQSLGAADVVIDRYGRLADAVLARGLQGQPDRCYLDPIDHAPHAVLRAESVNEWLDRDFPARLSFATRQPVRPPLRMYSAPGGILYADVCGYQVYNAELSGFFSLGSPFCYSNSVLATDVEDFPGDLIVIADIFNGSNFSHFTFDWLGRLNAYMEASADKPRKFAFVAGGVPGPLHKLLIDAVCDLFKLDASQLIFPTRPRLLRAEGKVAWFSDAYEHNTVPGHLMHPATVGFLRQVAARLAAPRSVAAAGGARLYISRADARGRRIANEDEVRDLLSRSGFRVVELARMSMPDQIATVRAADIIVGPHGMGLTHLAFHVGRPKVLELFHPEVGTDTYAVLSRSRDFEYRYIVGAADSGLDFNIPIEALAAALSGFA